MKAELLAAKLLMANRNFAGEFKASASAPDETALDLLVRILHGEVATVAIGDATQFRTRFQQLTGPLMAKSVEDTLFFRQHMALALNKVGAEPLARHFSLDQFHAEMQARREHQPMTPSAAKMPARGYIP